VLVPGDDEGGAVKREGDGFFSAVVLLIGYYLLAGWAWVSDRFRKG
jgi:hypothetical protein